MSVSLIRLGPDPEYSIYGKLSLCEIIRWDLMPLGNYPFTIKTGSQAKKQTGTVGKQTCILY